MNKIDEFTYELLTNAGIKKGMRILDVGCGTGEVSLLAAELTGIKGEVIGIDMSKEALESAEKTVRERVFDNVSFILADLKTLPDYLGQFDAVIGRRVLMYQSDAIDSLKKLIPFLKNNGLMVFQESDSLSAGFSPVPMPLHSKVQSWIWETVKREGGDIHMGLNLYGVFKKAGLMNIKIQSKAVLELPENKSDLVWLIEMMMSRIIKQGVANEKEIDISTLEQRLNEERIKSNTVMVRDMFFGVWGNYRIQI